MKREPFRTTWTLDDEDCTVEFRYYPGHPGSWYRRNGDPGDPPEPDELEVISIIRKKDGADITEDCGESLSENDNFREHATEIYAESLMPEEP